MLQVFFLDLFDFGKKLRMQDKLIIEVFRICLCLISFRSNKTWRCCFSSQIAFNLWLLAMMEKLFMTALVWSFAGGNKRSWHSLRHQCSWLKRFILRQSISFNSCGIKLFTCWGAVPFNRLMKIFRFNRVVEAILRFKHRLELLS